MSLSNRPAPRSLHALDGRVRLPTQPVRSGSGRPAATGVRRPPPVAPHQHAFVVRPGKRSGWRWWLERADGRALAASARSAASPEHARLNTLLVRLAAATAPVEIYQDDHGLVRWLLLSRAGALLAVSAAGYDTRVTADAAISAFRYEASHAELRDD